MKVVKVPVDMSSEQKDILGVVSKRQLMYALVGAAILYSYLPTLYKFLNLFGMGVIINIFVCVFFSLPTIFIVIFLGFTKVEKYNMNRDYYYLILLQKKTQYGKWRKGR